MANKFLDATLEYSDPANSGLQVLDGSGDSPLWADPDGEKDALDALNQWSKPEIATGVPISDMPEGTKIKFGRMPDPWNVPIPWLVIGHNLTGMPDGSITLIMEKIEAVLPFDAKEPKNKDFNRTLNGNNDYGVSNIRQWLNSSAPAGNWYSPQHIYDAPPSPENVFRDNGVYVEPYDTLPGFLNSWTKEEQGLLLSTTRQYGGYPDNGTSCVDNVFLLTTNELGYDAIDGIDGNGTKIPYFSDNNSRIAQCSDTCKKNSHYKPSGSGSTPSNSTEWMYFTATSEVSSSYWLYRVQMNGTGPTKELPYTGYLGIRAACNIPDTTLITDTTDADGCYNLIL